MKTWKHFTFLAIIAIFCIVVAFTACDDGNNGTTDNDKTTKFEGTWNKQDSFDDPQLIFKKNDFLYNIGAHPLFKGTFTFTENEFQFSITHQWGDNQWDDYSISASYQYTFIDNNTFVFSSDDYPNDSLLGTWEKLDR